MPTKVPGSSRHQGPDLGDKIGKIEDMIITAEGTVPYAVVSLGGILGMDAHHVVVAASALKALPNFTFAS